MSNKLKGLYDQLFDSIEKVKDGSLDVKQAKVIAEISSVIIQAGKLEYDVMKETQEYELPLLNKSNKVNGYLELQKGR